MSRTKNAIINTKYAIISKIVSLLLGFVSRTVFISILGTTYLGINGLYTEVLSVLSFAELGFGTALIYAMYAPVAHNDEQTIIKLLDFYKKVYRIIAAIIAVGGLAIVPFLQYIVRGADTLTLFDLRLYFLIFLTNTVTSYFVTYKYSYINALQKNYLVTNISTVISFATVILQIITIFIFRSFLIYLLTQTTIGLLSKIVISLYLNKQFPILKKKPTVPLSKEEKQPIYREVRGLIVHQFSSVAVHATDNIIISSLTGLGVVAVGFVSNYNMLMNAVLGFVKQIFGSVTSGFGNLAASSSKEHFRKVFLTSNFINFWIYGFCCIAFYILIPPFITLWIGADKLIDPISFLLIIVNCYLQGQCTIFDNARVAVGNFNKDKWWSLAQALVNLIVSIIGAKALGLVGIYIGTVASRLVFVIFRPYSTYSYMFGRTSREYYFILIKYLVSVVLAGIVAYSITSMILTSVTIIRFLISAVVVAIVPNAVFFVFYYKTEVFKDVLTRIKDIRRIKSV